MEIQIIISFIIYSAILITISLIAYKKSKTEQSFVIGNRSLNYWVTAISAQTSDMGSWLFLAYPAAVFLNGVFEIWTAIGLVIFMFLTWQFIAKKIRTETEKYNSLTLPSYFEKKFNDKSGAIKVFGALFSIIFFIFYISAGFVGMGRLFEAAFNINYSTGLFISSFVTVFYILIGGFLAISWSNLFQGFFLLAMIMLVPLYSYNIVGGIESIKLAAMTKNISLNLFPDAFALLNALFLSFGWGLGYFGQPHIIINFMGIDDPENIKKAKWVGITWQILVLFSAISIGLVGIAFFKDGLTNPEHLFVLMVKNLFSPLIAGFVFCGILAATLSTVNTQILVAATNLSEDIYKNFRKKINSKEIVLVSKISVVLIATFSFILSLNNSDTIYNLVQYSWSGLGSTFGPLVILTLYTNKVNKYGAISGIISGGLISAIWPYFNSAIPSLIPGFFLTLLIILIISKITSK